MREKWLLCILQQETKEIDRASAMEHKKPNRDGTHDQNAVKVISRMREKISTENQKNRLSLGAEII
jgi:hypothetical protein